MIFSPIKTRFSPFLPALLFLLASLAGTTTARAHKVASASLILYLSTENARTFQVSTQMEVESSGNAALDDEIGPQDAARIFVETQLMVLIDEKDQPHSLKSELINESDEATPRELQRHSVLVTWDGVLPADGKELSLYLKETSEMSIVIATVKNGTPGRRLQVMFAGEYSRAENIEPLVKGNPFDEANPKVEAKVPPPAPEDTPVVPPATSGVMTQLKAGGAATFHKMFLPLALLLSLILLKGSLRALIAPFVVFLLSHSLGLSMAATGLIPLFPWSISVCAVMLLALAIDNLFSFKFRSWRYFAGVLGGFFLGNVIAQSGTLFGFGGNPVDLKAIALFQIGFDGAILLAALLLGGLITLFGRSAFFRWIVVIPLSIVLAGVALFLFLAGNPVIDKFI